MKSSIADVSVVIPLYNHESYIESTLESVFGQSLKPREVIVVDDGSTDDSFKLVLRKFGGREDLICWTKPNGGAHHAINSGIYRATSSYISILNSDDIYEENRIEKCIENLESDKDADMACTGISFIDGKNKIIKNTWYEDALKFYRSNGDLAISLINGNFLMTTSNFVIRKAAFERFGYFSNYRYVHDLSFLMMVIVLGGKINILDEPLLKYRMHDTNTISEGVLKVKVELAAVIAEYLARQARSDKGITGDFLEAIYSVLDSHNLSRMVFPFLSEMLARGCIGEMDKVLAESGFSKAMLNITR